MRLSRLLDTCSMLELGGLFYNSSPEKIKEKLLWSNNQAYTPPPMAIIANINESSPTVICNLRRLGFKRIASYSGNEGKVYVYFLEVSKMKAPKP